MFTSNEWVESRAAKDPKGKKATDIVLMSSFWNVVYALKAMGPIVRVLRLVDNEKRPAMGYIYEAMDRAKEAIQKAFNGKEENNSNIEMDCEVLEGLYKCIDRFSENDEFVDHIHNELSIYKRVGDSFKEQKQTQALKASRLALHECYECRDLTDPIALKDIDGSNELIMGELNGEGEDAEDELVFDDDVLTWRDVVSATGAVEPLKYTRRKTQMQRTMVASTSNKEKGKGVVEVEDEDESSQDEGEEEYNSSCNGSDEDNDMELEEDEED
ncbi:hypothetical protein CR513_54459, partial [Mucuna pruriens]